MSATGTYSLTSYEQVVQNGQLFMDTVQDLHKSQGSKFMVPIMGGKALDLHRLFVEVTARGGLEKVIRDRQWKEIIAVFNFPSTITNASFVLRKYYINLLHHYEQVYYFRKQGPPSVQLQAATPPCEEKNSNAPQLPENSELWTGRWVTGAIDGKFDNGYLVTVSFGSEKLKGVLYHAPVEPQKLGNAISSKASRRRNRKRSRMANRDPFHPKPNRSGYNFFYSEHYARLKSLHHGQEKTLSTKISHLWSKLTEGEKQCVTMQVYQEKGAIDKQRYEHEMTEYRKSSGSAKPK
ncbi:hypothetical protein IFM89_037177 [Coptis chinensis]|uniref:Uncharacterized protein n=1 Tax=Coptis chinensis TaxID=261450 RepID=A0A835I882_9MAGN|nr:hypothetical protein IFM89_037177 [Coptis chinensis]